MKKFFSLVLSLVMVCSLSVSAFASHETLVTYEGQGVSEYLLTVPAALAPGASGEVKLEGTWPSNETIVVTADSSVTLTNDIDNSTKVLDIGFDGISQVGDNTNELLVVEDISVSPIENALFGTWSGEFYYNLSIEGASVLPDSTFADYSWSEIIEACESNNIPSTWYVGDNKPMTINGQEYNVQIIGKDHDTYTNGGTAPLTFQLVEVYTEARMNATGDNTTGWSGSEMRTTTLPEILTAMPSEVQSAIKPVDKQTLNGDKNGLETTSDKLFLLSEIEVLGTTGYSNDYAEGNRYDFYANGGSTIKYLNGGAKGWWLRGPIDKHSRSFTYIHYTGYINDYETATVARGVAFGFCF